MNYFAIPPGLTCLLVLFIGVLVYFKNRASRTNLFFCLFCLSLSGWLLGYTVMYLSGDPSTALAWGRIGFVFIIFIPVLAYHFILIFLKIVQKKVMAILYLIAFISIPTAFTDLIYNGVEKYFWGYYPTAGKFYFVFLFMFFLLFSAGLIYLLKGIIQIRTKNRLLAQQYKYVFFAFLFGTTGVVDYIIKYKIEIYPFGYIAALIFISVIAYAIIKYRLMDIRIAFSRVGIFILVYTLVLGIPFWIGAKLLGLGLWLVPTGLCALLATAGPSFYIYLQRKAEDRILQEEKRIRDFLETASREISEMRDLQKLCDRLIILAVKVIKLTNASVYILERKPEDDEYILKSSSFKDGIPLKIDAGAALVQELKNGVLLIYEEFKLISEGDNHKDKFEELLLEMKALQCSVIVPISKGGILLGFLTLGERKDQRTYSTDVLTALNILANQTAQAIDYCKSVEAENKKWEEEGLRERIASLDHMANSMAHVIDNPVQIILVATGNMKHCFSRDLRISMPEEVKTDILDSLARCKQAAERISGMVEAILDYSRMGTGQLQPVSINEAVKSFLFLIEPKIKEEKVHFVHEVQPKLPPILGNKIHLEEIIMNFVMNSIHAVRRKEEKNISLKIFQKDKDTIRVECADNGYGIPKKIIKDIFLSYETTKGAEGTGLGLYRVRKIVDLYKGRVWAESEGEGKGAVLVVELQIYKGKNLSENKQKE